MSVQILEKKIKNNYSFGKTTRFGVGGKVRRFYVAKSESDLIAIVKLAKTKHWPIIIVGEGTNLVVNDGLNNFFVIKSGIKGIKVIDSRTYEVGARENWTKLVALFNKQGLGGAEKMYGIPGSVGGAVVGNAGCYGQEIKDVVSGVKVFDGKKAKWLNNAQCRFSYRSSIFKQNRVFVILKIKLHLTPADPLQLIIESRNIFRIRNNKFPENMKCAGSYFKNIVLTDLRPSIRKKLEHKFRDKIKGNKLATAVLVEIIGLNGARIGNVKIANYHGNLVVNMGSGKARDALQLAQSVKNKVKKIFNIKLEEEVRII